MTKGTPEKANGPLRPNLGFGLVALLSRSDVVVAHFGQERGYKLMRLAILCMTAIAIGVPGLILLRALLHFGG